MTKSPCKSWQAWLLILSCKHKTAFLPFLAISVLHFLFQLMNWQRLGCITAVASCRLLLLCLYVTSIGGNYCYRHSSMVCLSVKTVSPAKSAQLIVVPIGILSRVGPMNTLNGDQIQYAKWQFWRNDVGISLYAVDQCSDRTAAEAVERRIELKIPNEKYHCDAASRQNSSITCCALIQILESFSLTDIYLWSPYVIGQTIILLPCDFFLSIFFFPCLISAVGDWMSTILLHMVWP